MLQTPKGMRIHIGIFGKCNVGKSSLLNLITQQNLSIVSDLPGTTTDPVEKAMELHPLGAILLIDTAGIDDDGLLGKERISRSFETLKRINLALLVTEEGAWGTEEEELIKRFKELEIPFLIVCNKIDINPPSENFLAYIQGFGAPLISLSAKNQADYPVILEAIIRLAPPSWYATPSLLGDLITPNSLIVLVTPIDLQAPKGRLILPQVQAIRDALDHEAICIITKESNLQSLFQRLRELPALVVCDSQCVRETIAHTPENVKVTTFSILMARLKGDLTILSRGARAIHTLKEGDKVLIAEACTHHALEDDIGRVKIPHLLRQFTGKTLEIHHCNGKDYPENLKSYKLIIHCGACTLNQAAMLSRLAKAQESHLPITNYGIALSLFQGVLARSLEIFPDSLRAYEGKTL
ncbi:MAG: [FeFe] hydrogenase H-cluster maturation GTPase HydF [Wolinella sp.]